MAEYFQILREFEGLPGNYPVIYPICVPVLFVVLQGQGDCSSGSIHKFSDKVKFWAKYIQQQQQYRLTRKKEPSAVAIRTQRLTFFFFFGGGGAGRFAQKIEFYKKKSCSEVASATVNNTTLPPNIRTTCIQYFNVHTARIFRGMVVVYNSRC